MNRSAATLSLAKEQKEVNFSFSHFLLRAVTSKETDKVLKQECNLTYVASSEARKNASAQPNLLILSLQMQLKIKTLCIGIWQET